MPGSSSPLRRQVVAAFVGFGAFGSFWGAWGASVPRIREQAGVTDGELGLALLFVGAGALPAMLLAGRALDRWGLKLAALTIGALGTIGAVLAVTSVGMVSLSAGLALVGVCSGAADVAINSLAGRVETVARRPVITRAHGVFSSAVVLASLGTGLAYAASLPPAVPFLGVALLCLLAAGYLLRALPQVDPRQHEPTAHPRRHNRPRITPLVLIGVLGALAFASENAHQSWSAVYAHVELQSSPGLTAVAPAVFAATVAITRFSVGGVGAGAAQAVLLAGGLAAGAGALVIAAAPTLVVAIAGLVVAAAGTAVLFPTLLGIVSRTVEESRRGRATATVTTVAYLGFLLGPVYVGLWAAAVGLRGAMVAVAALAVVLVVLTPALLRLSGLHGPGRDGAAHAARPRCRGRAD